MAAEIALEGVDELIAKLNAIGANVNTLSNKALKAGAEPIFSEMVANAPVRTGKAKAELKIGKVKTKNGIKYLLIGLDKGDISKAFYLKFSEFGTSKMPAKPFMGPAYEQKKTQALENIRKVLKEGLR